MYDNMLARKVGDASLPATYETFDRLNNIESTLDDISARLTPVLSRLQTKESTSKTNPATDLLELVEKIQDKVHWLRDSIVI